MKPVRRKSMESDLFTLRAVGSALRKLFDVFLLDRVKTVCRLIDFDYFWRSTEMGV